ncbi:DMT family transporter: phosphate/phosphoenolpyruvate, partial [Reticulomyxa filosa]
TAVTCTGVSSADSSLIGFTYMFLAELAEAIKLVLSQKLMHGVTVTTTNNNKEQNTANTATIDIKFTEFEGLYYYAPTATVWMCVLALPLEIPSLKEAWADKNSLVLSQYWYLFIIVGILGFGTNIAAWMVTGVISSLYLKALAVSRNSGLVLLNVVFFGEIVTSQQFVGYVISLFGFGYYNYLKMK